VAGSPQHATLSPGVVTTLTFDGDYQFTEVTNVDGTAAVYFTTSGATPAVEGTGSHVVVAGAGAFTEAQAGLGDNLTVVRLISAGGPKVSVRVW
jgi:hypothetical protein